jgi:soluble lytic murein transglycosylase-like protein
MRRFALIFILAASSAFAGEYAVLTSGGRLHIDRHEADGAKVRLFYGNGFAEMNLALVRGFEDDGIAPPPPAPPAPEPAAPVEAAPAAVLAPLELADAAADKYGLPRELVRSVMLAESGLAPGAISPKGAIGLMQLMPGTAQVLGADPYDPAQNVDAGARYLRDLLEKYNYGLRHALAAYNAGPGAVDKYNGVPPYRETINYVSKIEKKLKAANAIKQ